MRGGGLAQPFSLLQADDRARWPDCIREAANGDVLWSFLNVDEKSHSSSVIFKFLQWWFSSEPGDAKG